MNILLTGGSGYLGRHLVKLLPDSNNLFILDCSISESSLSPKMNVNFFENSIQSEEFLLEIFQQHNFDVVIHLAAKKSVQESLVFANLYDEVNAVATSKIASLSTLFGVKKFIFASSAAVYGNSFSSEKILESNVLMPLNPYGLSKVNAEKFLDDEVAKGSSTSFITLRLFNLAGYGIADYKDPRQNSLFPTIAKNILGGQKTRLNGFNLDTTDGSCIRDYVHVNDVANAFIEIMGLNFADNSHQIFNVCRGEGASVLQVINLFREISGQSVPIDYCDPIVGDPMVSVGDFSKIKNAISWKPVYDLESMVISTWKAFSA
jgi:UDP-glucose 4-epimerase